MGLDSLELLMEIEHYFGIRIPNAEAEKLYTIQNFVDTVATHLHISNNSLELRDTVFNKVNSSMMQLGWTTEKIKLSDLIGSVVPTNNKEYFTALSQSLQLSVPRPEHTRTGKSGKISEKLKSLISWDPAYDSAALSFEHLVVAICASNYQELIVRGDIKNRYEIYIAISGITADKVGVDYYELSPEKSFTTDLGID
jgi:acyl carrier protein